MNEKLITICLGLAVGLVITVGVLFGPQLLSKFSAAKPSSLVSPISQTAPTTPTSPKTPSSVISIDTPSDGDIISQKSVAVAGKTFPNVSVYVVGPGDDQVTKSDVNGLFQVTLKLDEGENLITAGVTDSQGNLVSDSKTVVLEITNQ